MNEEQKSQLIAEAENVEAIREFLNEMYDVNDLFETAANACSVLLHLVVRVPKVIPDDDMKHLQKLIDQHVMLANLLKPFTDRKDGDA